MSFESRRWIRRQYLTRYQVKRRAALKAAGGLRIEVTLCGPALDHYLIIRQYLGNGGNQQVITKALNITAAAITFAGQTAPSKQRP